MCLQRGVGDGIPHRRDKKEAASKFRAFKGQQFHLAWSRRLGSPCFTVPLFIVIRRDVLGGLPTHIC